jgi:hypothetical protein
MKKLVLAVALVALAVPAAAAAGPPPGKGKPPTTGARCKPRVSVLVQGVVTSDPEAGATTFAMNVRRANRHGRQLVTPTATSLTVTADLTPPATTKVRRKGKQANLDALEANDRVLVHFRVCKADLAGDAASDLAALQAATARHVFAHAPKSAA